MARSKFNVDKDISKRTFNEIVFDSVLEMKYYRDVICPKMESGEIINCELQKSYELQPKFTHDGKAVLPVKYVADFVVTYKDNHTEVIDTKGMPDTTALLKKKLFWYVYPNIDYKWITYVKKFGGWLEYDEVKKLRSQEKKNKKVEEK